MFLQSFIHRKLSSLLQPWLLHELELELNLGFLHSHATASNMQFDTSALNRLLDESTNFSFADVRVDQLNLRVSHWSAPAFSFELRGLHVTLAARRAEEIAGARRQSLNTSLEEDVKKALYEIDPEGCALHDVMGRISKITCSRSWTSSLLNVVLTHCCLKMHDINLLVQSPISENSYSCSLEINDFNAESPHIESGCFIRGFLTSLFSPSRKSYFDIEIRHSKIGLKSKDHVGTVFSLTDLVCSVKLKDLQLINIHCCIPELDVSFSPADVSIILALSTQSSKCSMHMRSGRQLWSEVAYRMRSLIYTHRWSMHKVISIVCTWLRYIHAYENLLLLVGYPTDKIMKRSAMMMSEDQIFLRSFQQQWKVISQVEKELPTVSIALARRIVRYRVATNFIEVKNELLVNSYSTFYQKILQMLALVWNTICGMLYVMIHLLLPKNIVAHPKMNICGVASEELGSDQCFSVGMGKISITISPESSVSPCAVGKAESDLGSLDTELLSFCLSVDALILIYNENVCEHCLSFSCGSLMVMSSSFVGVNSPNNGSVKGRQKKRVDDSRTVLWGKHAALFNYAEAEETGSDETSRTSVPYLQSLLQQMWLNWKNSLKGFEESETRYSENPFILCEMRNILADQDQKNMTCCFWRCCLAVGKLDSFLGYSSILSFSLLFRQMQDVLCLADRERTSKVFVCTPTTYEDSSVAVWDAISCIGGMETALHNTLPEKLIQVGVFMTGPRIRVSLRKGGFHTSNSTLYRSVDDVHLAFDFGDIELAMSPTLPWDRASSNGAAERLWLKEPEAVDIPKLDDDIYGSQGRISLHAYLKFNSLNAYVGDSAEIQQLQVLDINPITIQLSSLREEVHSLGTTVIAFSAALHGIATGLTVLFFVDELSDLVEGVVSLTAAVSCAVNSIDSIGLANSQNVVLQEVLHGRSEIKGSSLSRVRGPSLVFMRTLFVINCTSEIHSVDLVLHKSRRTRKMENQVADLEAFSIKSVALHDMPDNGICISAHRLLLEFSSKSRDKLVEILTNFSGLRVIIFRFASQIMESPNHYDLSKLLLQSLDCLYEVSVSSCEAALWLSFIQKRSSRTTLDAATSGSSISHIVQSFATVDTEGSIAKPYHFGQKAASARKVIGPASSNWICIKISSSEIFLAGCHVKHLLAPHQSNKLDFSLSVGGEHQTLISCQCQGGLLFLESESAVILYQCLTSYLHCIINLSPVAQSHDENLSVVASMHQGIVDDQSIQATQTVLQQVKWETVEELIIGLSQLSLALVDRDGSGRLQELLFCADVHFDLEMVDLRRKFSFGISNMSALSHVQGTSDQKSNEIEISFFSSGQSNGSSSHLVAEDERVAFQNIDGIGSVPDDASCSSHSVTRKEPYTDYSGSQVLQPSPRYYILKQLGCFVAAQEFAPRDRACLLNSNQCWFGAGSISGLDVTISLTEMQMISSAAESLSGVFQKHTIGNVEQTCQPVDQESERNMNEMAPDGSIVAIQDIHQHMYISVEVEENKYRLVGAIHHSLVGERALFRVKYHYRRRWNSPVLYFSLTSLHARSESGEPLHLNCRPRSGFVEISCSHISESALWRAHPCKTESYEGDNELESYNTMEKRMFHVVNKKNGCAIAFIDEVLEFVNKPGNPFKWKIIPEFSLTHNLSLDCPSAEAAEADVQHTSYVDNKDTSGTIGNVPCINITIEKLSLTIVHELSDTDEKFPLLRASISVSEFIVQLLCTKARVITRLVFELYYFDGQRNLWRELAHPIELCMFFRSKFECQGLQAVPVHFYARVKKLDISITELSLDLLLFVIGKLNLAGPFAVRSSAISANCCKVENQSGLLLLCHFPGNQNISVAGKQSTTMFLRHLALSQPPEASSVSIQLAEGGAFTTSPIHILLSETRAFAWRTRIISAQDSKTYPGPFVVVEPSRKAEDVLSIVVSPLFRIHNETDFPMELRFLRPQQEEAEHAYMVLAVGDAVDDSMAAFGAIKYSGGVKKALRSLSIGNFLFSFRPKISDEFPTLKKSSSVEWSDGLKGGKATRLSGLFDKLNYQVRKAFPVESVKCSFSTAHSSVKFEDGDAMNIHFLIQSIERDVPVIQPNSSGYTKGDGTSPVALQKQKEIFLLPTVQISNFLQLEIHVLLTDNDPHTISENVGKQSSISCGSTANFYVNPEAIFFTVTLTAFSSSCKPVNSGDWFRKLLKEKKDVHSLEIALDFGNGKYFAFLRLSRGHRGILEAAVFTSYTLKNDTGFGLFCLAPSRNPLSRDEAEKLGSGISPQLGTLLPPKSTKSWFMRSNKVRLRLLEVKASEALLDLDALSGLTEIDLEVEGDSGFKYTTKLCVSLQSSIDKVVVPSQIVSLSPRYVLLNDSEDEIFVRQCYLEDDMEGMIAVSSRQKKALQLRNGNNKPKETSIFENFIRKHRNAQNDTLLFIQFQPKKGSFGWSGPVCITSLGRFFIKFRRSTDSTAQEPNNGETNREEFAVIHILEENSTLVLHFRRPPDIDLPYRIENCLHDASITYYQKGFSRPETLGSATSINYVWDDLTLPHKLVIQIDDVHLLREINLDKVRAWKLLFRFGQQRAPGFHSSLDKKAGDQKRASFGHLNDMKMVNLGYEVYADGLTRVLRICELDYSRKQETVFYRGVKITVRVSNITIQLSEQANQEMDSSGPLVYTPIVLMRLENINLDSVLTDQHSLYHIHVQSMSVDQKWLGAPFAAMLRRHQSDYDANNSMLRVVFILLPPSSNIKKVKYSSIVLQPLDLNLDEETLMKIIPFWRTSLSDPTTSSQQYYFDHFEIHPLKIIASFLPGDSYSSYSSTQEIVRSLLHSVIKVPPIKSKTVELNGILVTHALITIRELSIKCAQHYSWYVMRAIYIAKGSPLLPPAFASIFDDSASSSLDVFFDPSSGLVNLPGLTLGTFKLLSKCIDGKGFSGTKRYFGDLGKTLRAAGSNILFAAVTEVSDSVLKGAESSGVNGMVNGFHQGLLKLAMEPSLLGSAFMEGGPDRKIKLDRNPGVDELYIEGYLQAMLDTIYKQEYLRVRVIDKQVVLKNLPPNSTLIDEIVDRVKSFLVSKGLLKGGTSSSHSLRHLRGESEWRIGPTILTLCEHLFVSFAIRGLRNQAGKVISRFNLKGKSEANDQKAIVPAAGTEEGKVKLVWKWGIGKFVLSGIVAYLDGRLCRCIPNPIARRIVSGFLLSFLDQNDDK